jgi:VanZ family protein
VTMLRALPALAWAGLIFFLSALSKLPEQLFVFDGVDKVFHAGAYGVLALLLLLALPAGGSRDRAALIAVALASVYGASDEFHQYFVPGRSCDVFDWLADSGGAALAVGAFRSWREWLVARARGGSR